MSAHDLLNLLNELGKRDKMRRHMISFNKMKNKINKSCHLACIH